MSTREGDDLKGLITANSFSGLPTFFRRQHGHNFSIADVVVYGLPYDLGVSNRPGSRFGPRRSAMHRSNSPGAKSGPGGLIPLTG